MAPPTWPYNWPPITTVEFLDKWIIGRFGPEDVCRIKADLDNMAGVSLVFPTETHNRPRWMLELYENDLAQVPPPPGGPV